MTPAVYLPIEIKARELPSRLVMASRLVEAGFAVVIGNQWSLTGNLAALPPGVVMFKTVNKIQGAWMAAAKAAGHVVVANDEEVLNFIEPTGYLISFSDTAAAHCDMFFAQSTAHAGAVTAAFPVLAGKTQVTGNPRVDLMTPEDRAAFAATDPRLEALKPYILVNTNYGSINSIWADDQMFFSVTEKSGAFDPPNAEQKIKAFWDIIAWERENYEAMVALLRWLLPRIQGVSLVIRPHPIERPDHWETLVAQIAPARASKIAVIPRSNPHPWLMGAELVIHTGCTTGLEAALMDRPTLNLLPADHPTAAGLVNEVNPTFRTVEGAARALKQFLATRSGPLAPPPDAAAAAFRRHLPSYRKRNAARLITGTIAGLLTARGAMPLADGNTFSLPMRAPYRRHALQALAKDKFSATEDEIADGLDVAARITGAARPYRLATLDDGVFLVTPA